MTFTNNVNPNVDNYAAFQNCSRIYDFHNVLYLSFLRCHKFETKILSNWKIVIILYIRIREGQHMGITIMEKTLQSVNDFLVFKKCWIPEHANVFILKTGFCMPCIHS